MWFLVGEAVETMLDPVVAKNWRERLRLADNVKNQSLEFETNVELVLVIQVRHQRGELAICPMNFYLIQKNGREALLT